MDEFQLSKIAGLFATAGNLGIALLLLGFVLRLLRFRRTGWLVLHVVALGAIAVALLPVSQWVARPLEDRFPRGEWPACVDGIVVISSAEQPTISQARNTPVYFQNEGAIVAAVELSRRYPSARLAFTGGSGSVSGSGLPASGVARGTFVQLGLDPNRILFEERSRNTWENLLFTKQMVEPRPGETWLLVAAAMHMPRSMGIAQHLGWPRRAWSTDYRTLGEGRQAIHRLKFSRSLLELDDAVHEWVGLAGYRATGKIDSLFPAPQPPEPDVGCTPR